MADLKEGEKKKTKLSLSKRLQKFERVKHKPNDKSPSLFGDGQDMNETCDFRDASSFNKLKPAGDNRKNKEEESASISTKEKSSTTNTKDSSDSSVYHCQVCNKDLTHYNIQRRQQHVNRCIDKIEDSERIKIETESLIEKVRNAVLNCPMCGKNFKSESGRVSHLKKCSRTNNVSTESLLQLIKDQEKERNENLDAGIIPTELRTKITKTTAPKKKKIKEPTSQYEEDIQVAMAMSSSMNSEQLTAGSNIVKGKNGKKKGKEVLEDVCLLHTLTDVDRQRRMEEKINTILHMSNCDQAMSSTSLFDSGLKSNNSTVNLWNIGSHSPDTYENVQFYVGTLIPPLTISDGDPRKNLRRMSTIPGREKSFVDRNESMIKTMNTSSNQPVDDIISVSTQTAVVLAELASDDDVIHTRTNQNVESLKSTNHDVEASGFCVETLSLDKSVEKSLISDILSDYKKLINNEKYSDVNIITCSGDRLYAHSVILMVRCPALLKVSKDSTITMEYTTDVVLTALRFIYTGEVIVTENCCEDLKKLAEQYELSSLISACDKLRVPDSDEIVSHNDDAGDGDNDVNNAHEISLINVKDIWGESDSELDTESVNNDNDEDGVNNDYDDDNEKKDDDDGDGVSNDDDDDDDDDDDVVNNDDPYNDDNVHNTIDDDNECDSQSDIDRMIDKANTDSEGLIMDGESSDDHENKLKDNDANSKIKNEKNVSECQLKVDRKRKLSSSRSDCSNSEHSNKHQESFDLNSPLKDNDVDSSKHKKIRLTQASDSDTVSDNVNVNRDIQDSIVLSDNSDVDIIESLTNKIDSQKHIDKASPIKTKETDGIRHDISNSLNPAEVSTVELNDSFNIANSSADLFASPSPEQSKYTGIKQSMTLGADKQICLDFSSPTSKTSLEKVDVDEGIQDDQGIDTNESIDCSIPNSDKGYGDVGNITGKVVDRTCIEDCNDYSGDDLEITGDNLDEIGTPSPTFKRTLKNTRTVSSPFRMKTKYLDTKFSPCVKKSLKIFGADMSKKSGINEESNDDDIIVLEENENEVSDDKRDEMNNDKTSENFGDNNSNNFDMSVVEDERVEANGSHGDEKEDIHKQLEDFNEDNGEQVESDENAHSPIIGDMSMQSYNGDVWDDFDDCGVGYEPPIVSPEPLVSPRSTESKHEGIIDLSKNDNDDNDDNICTDDNKQVADNISFLQDDDDSFIFEVNEDNIDDDVGKDNKKTSFKTPTVSTKSGKKWTAPSPFTPMPKYNEMATPVLKKELQKYGVKPVGKKRMLKMLEDIYQQTHQYETDSEIEDNDVVNSEDKGGHGNPSTKISDDDNDGDDDDDDVNSHCDNLSQQLEFDDIMEESCLHMTSSDSDTSGSPQKNVDVTKQLTNYMKSHSELHMKVLTFEPLELDVLKKNIKESGIKCSMDKLMDFLDERCIAFTTKNTRKNRVQKKARKKKTKSVDN